MDCMSSILIELQSESMSNKIAMNIKNEKPETKQTKDFHGGNTPVISKKEIMKTRL